jgi:hypothetical protein
MNYNQLVKGCSYVTVITLLHNTVNDAQLRDCIHGALTPVVEYVELFRVPQTPAAVLRYALRRYPAAMKCLVLLRKTCNRCNVG